MTANHRTDLIDDLREIKQKVRNLEGRMAVASGGGGAVSSVNGHTGTVVLNSGDVGAVPESVVTTKGDVLAATGSATVVRIPVGANGTVLAADSTQTAGVKWTPGGPVIPPFTYNGTLAVITGTYRWYNLTGATLTISQVVASVGTAPAGASIVVDVRKNGSTIFTTTGNRPTIAAGSQYAAAGGTPDVPTLANGDYWTVDIVQVGSTTAGASLTVQIAAS